MSNETDAVRVRMYRQGLGDCFLLSFPRGNGERPFHVMIDFGVLLGTPDAERKMKDVARSIARATGGSADGKEKGRVDVLVATHEHWDHLSGFIQAKDEIRDRVEVGEVWLAWTEDPGHPLAAELRSERKRKVAHLRAAASRMRGVAGMGATADGIDAVLAFFGARGGTSTADALENVTRRTDARVVYRRPGEAFSPPGLPGIRVYVLGPPEDRTLIKKSDPTRRGREVYELRSGLSLADTFFAAVARGIDDHADREAIGDAPLDADAEELAHPFEGKYRVTRAQAMAHVAAGRDGQPRPFFRDVYGFGPAPSPSDADADADAGASVDSDADADAAASSGADASVDDADVTARSASDAGAPAQGEAWRRIDGDWLGAAADLALALDSDTNNTSLALAIELGEGGPVLLFPGDAQVGNWLSWQALSWPADPRSPGGATVTADDLLRRTVLYKVGHHGSHNATLRAHGLEKMTSPDLVALIPVDDATAKKRKWEMPFGSLYDRLKARTRGRILRADHGRLPQEEALRHGASPAEYAAWQKRTPEDADGLWIEYHLDAPSFPPVIRR